MNATVNNFSLAGNKCIPKMDFRRLEFTYNSYGTFTKNKEQIQKFKETGDLKCIYQNELGKTCFQHDMAYENLKYLPRRIIVDKILGDKAFNIAKNSEI